MFALLGDAIGPVERATVFVMNGEDLEALAGDSVDDNVREARESDLPLERVTAVVLARRDPGVRPTRGALSRCPDGVEEADAKSVDTVLVSELCFHHFGGRKRVKPDVGRHRARRA